MDYVLCFKVHVGAGLLFMCDKIMTLDFQKNLLH